jgi:hypothetical protein
MDVIIFNGASILQLFAGEDEALHVWRDPGLILDLRLYILNGV